MCQANRHCFSEKVARYEVVGLSWWQDFLRSRHGIASDFWQETCNDAHETPAVTTQVRFRRYLTDQETGIPINKWE